MSCESKILPVGHLLPFFQFCINAFSQVFCWVLIPLWKWLKDLVPVFYICHWIVTIYKTDEDTHLKHSFFFYSFSVTTCPLQGCGGAEANPSWQWQTQKGGRGGNRSQKCCQSVLFNAPTVEKNIMKHALERPSSEQKVVKCPLGCLSIGQNTVKCPTTFCSLVPNCKQ